MAPAERIGGRVLARLLGAWYGGRPSSEELHAAVRRLVLDGRLPPGTRLPAERMLAESLGTSRTLVAGALRRLREEGFVTSHRGAGSWIALPDAREVTGPSGGWYPSRQPDVINLAQATPAAPPQLLEALTRARDRFPAQALGHGYQPHGLPELRERIAECYTRRGLPTTRRQVLVTHGAQHAFALILRMLVSPGDRVLVEHPTYPNALEAVRAVNATALPVAMDDDGWDLELLEATLRQASPRLAYLIPDFQNPTGAFMPAQDRERLGSLLRRTRTVAVIDETLVDIDLTGRTAAAPLASYADDHVITIGSASKSFWGGLRLGWLRAPEEFVQRTVLGRAAIDLGSPVFEQLVLADVLDRADEVLAHRLTETRHRRDTLVAALRQSCPQWTFRVPDGGLSLWCDLGTPAGPRLATAAEQHGVRVAPGARFAALPAALDNRLRVPFTLPGDQLREAVSRLALAAASVGEGSRAAAEWEAPIT